MDTSRDVEKTVTQASKKPEIAETKTQNLSAQTLKTNRHNYKYPNTYTKTETKKKPTKQ